MFRVDQALLAELDSQVADLNRAVEAMRCHHVKLSADESRDNHAIVIAAHLQGIYTQAEWILRQVFNAVPRAQSESEPLSADLLLLTRKGDQRPRTVLCEDSFTAMDDARVLDEASYAAMLDLMGFRDRARSSLVGELEPEEVFAQVERVGTAVDGLASGVRELHERLELHDPVAFETDWVPPGMNHPPRA